MEALDPRLGVGLGDATQEEAGRATAHLDRRLSHDGDVGVDHRHPRKVVEADERDVPGQSQAAPLQDVPGSLGEQVVRGEDGSRRFDVEESTDLLVGVGRVEADRDDQLLVERQAGFVVGAAEAAQATRVRRPVGLREPVRRATQRLVVIRFELLPVRSR